MKERPWLAILAVLILSAVLFLFSGKATVNGQGEANVPIFESVPDRVVVYQGDMALVADEMQIYSGKEVQVLLPVQAVPSTLQIIDGGNKITRFSMKSASDRGGMVQSSGTRNLLTWKSESAGSRKISLQYMMQGLSWTPFYIMEIMNDQRVRFQYRVGLRNDTGSSTIANVKLVSGEIGSPRQGSGIYYRQMTNAQFKVASYDSSNVGQVASSSPYIGATKISAHYTYDLPQAPLEKQGITFVGLLDKELKASQEFVWVTTTGEKVDIVYTITNDTGQPFAEGLVNVLKSGIFLGSDIIEWTPSGASGHVTVGSAVDIQAEKTVDIDYIKERNNDKEYLHKMKLTVKNFSGQTRTVKVFDQKYPDSVDYQFDTQPGSVGNNTYTWILTIPPGDSKTVSYKFFSDSRYQNPYQSYN